MDQNEEIKSRLDIVEIIREYIPLKPAGINFRAPCPFHREKTPSFMVSPEKQIWHCFGCGKGGDVFSFVMEIEGIGFGEALRNLAPKAGVTLQRQDPKISSQRNRIMDIMEEAANYYHRALFAEKSAEGVRKYLSSRGLTKETLENWRVGYSPDSWDDLLKFLRSRGYSENEIFLAGLCTKSQNSSRFYNRFRDRIMFPISDINGAVVALTARVRPEKEAEEKMGKYVNSPSTVIYDKSRIIFGLDKAKMAIKSEDLAIMVEGQMDVITAHQSGFKNVVASSGTALTEDQIKLIKRYINNIALAFDMDKAGQMAADRGIREAMRAEMNIKVVMMPNGKDPDECIKNNPKEWVEAVAKARPIMEYYFDKVFAGLNLEEVQDKRKAAKEILPIIMKLGNKIEQGFWLRKLSEKIEIDENLLRETISAQAKSETGPQKRQPEKEEPKIRQSREEMLSELLLALAIKFPGLLAYAISHIQDDQISGLLNKSFYKNLIIYYNEINNRQEADPNSAINYNNLKSWLEGSFSGEKAELSQAEKINRNQLKLLDRLVLLGDKDFYELDSEGAKREIAKISLILKKNYLMRRMREIEKTIGDYEEKGEGEKAGELLGELKMLSDEIREMGE
ncbi:MAG: DNA primase [Patescibacteria group bacterium]